MRIADIRASGLRGATPEGGWKRELRADDAVHTLIAVHTDGGLVGLGSVFTTDSLVHAALEVLRPMCLGELAVEPDRLTEGLHQETFWMGRGGTITHTISGINLALWDILGKSVRQPVGRLLGGRYRDRVRPYASLLMRESPGPLERELSDLAEGGWRAFKIGWGPFGRVDSDLDEEMVCRARDAVGPRAMLMVDAGGSDAFFPGDYKWAIRTARMLERYDVTWFEEPLPPDAMSDYTRLRGSSPVPIAGGEVLTRRQSYNPWIEAGAFDIVQPDVTKVGGLSEQRRIGQLAEDHGLRLIPHGWNTAIGLASDLQLASALPRTDLVEYIVGSPYVDGLVQDGWNLDRDGMLEIPSRPGLGIELDPNSLRAYAADPGFMEV